MQRRKRKKKPERKRTREIRGWESKWRIEEKSRNRPKRASGYSSLFSTAHFRREIYNVERERERKRERGRGRREGREMKENTKIFTRRRIRLRLLSSLDKIFPDRFFLNSDVFFSFAFFPAVPFWANSVYLFENGELPSTRRAGNPCFPLRVILSFSLFLRNVRNFFVQANRILERQMISGGSVPF